MATECFCTVCQRTVYVPAQPDDDAAMCPVCSSPLLPAHDEPA